MGKEYTFINPVFVFLAEHMVYFLAFSLLFYWFSQNNQNRLMVLSAGSSFALAEILGKLAGMLHTNLQPFAVLPDVNQLVERSIDNSFPSDHTILFFSICISFWLFKKGVSFLWLLLAFLLGLSRIWVGVHYPADVLTGALIAVASSFITYHVVTKFGFVQTFLDTCKRLEERITSFKLNSPKNID
jgi:undecaprenyl-diphosphatase